MRPRRDEPLAARVPAAVCDLVTSMEVPSHVSPGHVVQPHGGDVPPPVHGTGTDDTGYTSLLSRVFGLVPQAGAPSADMGRCGRGCLWQP